MTATDKSKILLIDDDRNLLVTLRDFLEFEGYEVVTAVSGEDGLECLERVAPDLIVLDMSMPGMGGIGFLNRIMKDGQPSHPVLVLTARAQMAEYFANVKVDGFVAKPCDPNDLLMEISRIVFLTRGKVRQGGAGARRAVLLGDDDDECRAVLRRAFADAGYKVYTAVGGAEVLEAAIVQRPHAIAIRCRLADREDGSVARMLREMPNTRNIPLVVFDAATAGAPGRVVGHAPAAVLAAVAAALAG